MAQPLLTFPRRGICYSQDMSTNILNQQISATRAGDSSGQELPQGQAMVVVEQARPELKSPRRYQVVILNDDYTPMEFVIDVLEQFFGMNLQQATQLMLKVHHEGRAGIGSYSRDVAETKATLVVDHARQHEHPLLCQAEPIP